MSTRPSVDWLSQTGPAANPAGQPGGSGAPVATHSGTLSEDQCPTMLLQKDSQTYPWETTVDDPQIVPAGPDYDLFFASGDWRDGTYSIVTVHSGSGIVIKVPNGATLATNAGAGHFISEDVWKMPAGGLAAANPAVDEYVTFRVTRVGGRTTSDGGDFCADLVIPALT